MQVYAIIGYCIKLRSIRYKNLYKKNKTRSCHWDCRSSWVCLIKRKSYGKCSKSGLNFFLKLQTRSLNIVKRLITGTGYYLPSTSGVSV